MNVEFELTDEATIKLAVQALMEVSCSSYHQSSLSFTTFVGC